MMHAAKPISKRTSWRYWPVFTLIIMLVGSGPGWAQGDSELDVDYTEFSLSDLMDVNVVYGASRYEQKTTEAPSAVTIITAEDIEQYGYRTIADVLNGIRSFHTTYDRNYHYAAVRGFGLPGDYNSRVLVLVDGQRINDDVSDAASVGTEFPVDLQLIHRIEIVRGPSSSLYGASAFFAIINVVTKRGSEFAGAEVSAAVGSYDAFEGRLTFGKQNHQGMEYMLSGTLSAIEGQDFYFPEFDSPENNNGMFVGGDKEGWSRLFGKLNYGGFNLTGAYSSRDKKIPTAPWETLFNNSSTETRDDSAFLSASYLWDVNAATSFMARAGFNHYHYEGAYVYDYAEDENDPVTPGLSKDYQTGQSVTTEFQLNTMVRENYRFVLGSEYRYNLTQDQGIYDEDPYWLYLDDQRNSQVWAAYGLADWQLHRKIALNLGVRYDHYESFGGTTNPRLALITNPVSNSALKFLYGTAFRAPNVYELFYNDGELTQKGNPNLQPETIETYEVVWEQELSPQLSGAVSAFRYNIEGLIIQQEDPADFLLVFANLGTVEAQGIEVETEARLSGGLRGRVSYSFQEARNADTGNLLTNAPQHLGKVNVVIPVRTLRTFAGLELQYTSERKTLAGGKTTDHLLTNLTITDTSFHNRVEFRGSIYNLFNVVYADPGAGEHFQDSLKQDGRSLRLQMIVHW